MKSPGVRLLGLVERAVGSRGSTRTVRSGDRSGQSAQRTPEPVLVKKGRKALCAAGGHCGHDCVGGEVEVDGDSIRTASIRDGRKLRKL